MDVQPQSCRDGYVCSGSSCKTSCTGDADCLESYFCSGNRCRLDAIAIDGAAYHTCALLADGTVRCWGRNDDGELGNSLNANSSMPVPVSNLANVTAISAGGLHTCAISGGIAYCWGSNVSGEVGTGTTTPSLTPQIVSGLGPVKAITAGGGHTCALMMDGTVRCWGRGLEGQLGNGSRTNSLVPADPVSGLAEAVAVSAGLVYTCARLADGTVRCWGNGTFDELGNNSEVSSPTPVTVAGAAGTGALGGVYFLATGGQVACALTTANNFCWGRLVSPIPLAIRGGFLGAAAIAPGIGHVCVLSGGLVSCWGDDTHGELGTGSPIMNSSNPTAADLPSGILDLTSGDYFSCVIEANGSAACWGMNDFGQLGVGNATDQSTPTAVIGW
jgi:alpha-tubulin suppressor-like RCC1 family protein